MSVTPFVHVDAALGGLPCGAVVELSDAERHHLHRVLRLPVGSSLEISDGRGGWAPATLTAAGAVLAATAVTSPADRPALEVAQALAKGRKVDEVVRELTELGVDGIVPVVGERSVSRPDEHRAARSVARWRTVARAACEQSRRRHRPRVERPRSSADLFDEGVVLLVAHPGAPPLPDQLDDLGAVEVVRLAIGPEGGWSDAEVTRFEAGGARLVGLGPTVLRTEHAAAAGLAVLAAAVGRWHTP